MISHIDALTKNYHEDTLHHFILLTPQTFSSLSTCYEWSNSFFLKLDIQNPASHQDILILDKEEGKTTYSIEKIEQVEKFTHHHAQELKRKFIVLKNAHLLNQTALNKLLKIFEEPSINITIFFLNETKQQLLPTIKSRSIEVHIPSANKVDEFPLFNSFEEFSSYSIENKLGHEQLIQMITNTLLSRDLNFKQMSKVQETIESIQEDKTYHNAKKSILFKLYNLLANN